MELEQTSGLSTSVRKDSKQVKPGQTRPISTNPLCTDDVEYTKCIPAIRNGVRMSNPPFTSSANPRHHRPYRRNGASSLVATDDDSSSGENSPEPGIASPKHLSAKNHVHLSQSPPKVSKYVSNSTSPPPSPPVPTSRVRVDPVKRATSKSFSTARPQPQSRRHSISDKKPPVPKKRKTRQNSSLDICTDPNPKSLRWPSSPATSVKASASQVDHDNLFTLEYDLDRDPTQETYEINDQFHDRSPFSVILSARFIHPHLFEKLSDSTTFNGELMNIEGDLVTEFIEPAALNSVGLHNAVSPSYVLDSAAALGNSDPTPTPGYNDLGLEGTIHVTDPFTVLTMDDVINHQPWGPNAETMIDPSILGGTPAFLGSRSSSPAPTPFRDFHSRKRAGTPSPSLTRSTLTIRIPSHTSTSSSGLNSAQIPGNAGGNSGGGKAKFYKKGTLQTPPHLSNPQRRRSVSAKTSENIQIGRRLSPRQTAFADSPLTELSASDFLASIVTSTSSIAAPDEDATIIGSGSGTPPPRVNSIRTVAARKQKSSTDNGRHRIIAVNKAAYCHQCRRSTSYPKMHCRACQKLYCILCIVKRYHNIEFHQFKKDFDCPACLDTCNCTACCDKRREVYITTKHVKFGKGIMDKLLSGEIRSLPRVSGFLAYPREKLKPGQDQISSRHEEPSLIARKEKTPARRKRVSYRRDTSDDDYVESDAPTAPNASVRVKPIQAALQTQRMLEESGSGRYWGTVYSLNGERVGMSYVGSNLQNLTVQTNDFSSVTDYPPSPPGQRRKRVYVGRWQDIWGFRPETLDDPLSEDEKRHNKRNRNNKELGRARFYYVGNQNVIRAWRKSRSKAVSRPPVAPLQSAENVEPHISPSDLAPFDKSCDRHEATDITPSDGILIDGEGEDEDDSRSFWIMEDRSSPKRSNFPLLATADIPRPIPGNVFDVRPATALESCGQLVTQEDLVKAVASGLQAVGTTVLLP